MTDKIIDKNLLIPLLTEKGVGNHLAVMPRADYINDIAKELVILFSAIQSQPEPEPTRPISKTDLQKQFEEQTPTIKDTPPIEYLQTFVTWLHLQIEKKPTRPSADEMMEVPLWQFKKIEDALRLTNNIYKLHRKETAYERSAFKAYEFAKELLEQYTNQNK